MKTLKGSVYIIGFVFLFLLILGCSNNVLNPPVLHKPLPQEGHFKLLIFTGNHEDIKGQIEDQYDQFTNHKLNSVTRANTINENEQEYYDITEFPTLIIYDHEKEVFRTNVISEALDYIENL